MAMIAVAETMAIGWLCGRFCFHSSSSRVSSLEPSHQSWLGGASGCGRWTTLMKHCDGFIMTESRNKSATRGRGR